MTESRRRLLMTVVGAFGLLAGKPLFSQQQTQGRPRPGLHPNPVPPPRDPIPGIDEPRSLDLKALQQENQQRLRANVSRLYEMAGNLKTEVEKTDAAATLSVSLIKKAREIEKLAKQVRNLIKGLS
jgi:hypothetical protein